MKTILQIIFTTLLSYIIQKFLPWWSVTICAGIIALFNSNTRFAAFWGGFVGVSLLWMGYATYIDIESHSILSQKVLSLFYVKSVSALIILTGCIGGIVGGMGALCGQLLRKVFYN
jgi:hypothetical protein